MDVLKNLEGKPQNILAINAAIENIQELYAGKGYILAKVTSIQDDPDNIITVKIDEGVIGDIKVEGNNKTKDFIVKKKYFANRFSRRFFCEFIHNFVASKTVQP